MKKLVIVALLAGFLVIAGCQSIIKSQWIGRTAMDLTASKGAPDQIEHKGLTEKIYVYFESDDGKSQEIDQEKDKNEQVEVNADLFWIDRHGKIIKVKQGKITISRDSREN